MNFNIESLSVRNHRVTMISQGETTIIHYVVDLYYQDRCIGFSVGNVSEECSFELVPEYKPLLLQMYDWRGDEYTTEIIAKKNEAGELVPTSGEVHADREDIFVWLEGQIAEWIKSNFD